MIPTYDAGWTEPGEAEAAGGFTVRRSGDIGQEIRGPDGKVIAWTTDSWVAQMIARLWDANEHLLALKRVDGMRTATGKRTRHGPVPHCNSTGTGGVIAPPSHTVERT
jgi:hypothetical protein